MVWVQLVTVLAALQIFYFSFLVGKARVKYGVKLPASSGHESFDRQNRVHMNTVEMSVIFFPLLWVAASKWPGPYVAAGLGGLYLVGRMVFLAGYMKSVEKRTPGFTISGIAIVLLALISIVGVVREIVTL